MFKYANCRGYFLKHTLLISFFYLFPGSLETTKVLLEAGADKGAQNKINKTAAQLGAFTGKINNMSLSQVML